MKTTHVPFPLARRLRRAAATALAFLLVAAAGTVLAAATIPKDVSYLLGMYYGSGSAFLVRETGENWNWYTTFPIRTAISVAATRSP